MSGFASIGLWEAKRYTLSSIQKQPIEFLTFGSCHYDDVAIILLQFVLKLQYCK